MTNELNPDLGDNHQVDYVTEMTKKFKDADGNLDVVALAKGKWESDHNHVPNLEQELAELRQDMATRSTLEQILSKIEETKAANQSNPGNQSMGENEDGKVPLQDVENIVRQSIEQERKRQTVDANTSEANAELMKYWGSDYESRLHAKAAELGVGKDFLDSMKATHPKAFLRLVLDQAPKGDPNAYSPPRSSVQPSQSGGQVKNYRYWQKIRKENPDYYHSVAAAKEREELASQMGDEFFR